MKKLTMMLVALAAASLGFTACGDDDESVNTGVEICAPNPFVASISSDINEKDFTNVNYDNVKSEAAENPATPAQAHCVRIGTNVGDDDFVPGRYTGRAKPESDALESLDLSFSVSLGETRKVDIEFDEKSGGVNLCDRYGGDYCEEGQEPADLDNDGKPDEQEFQQGTDPTDPDSDKDGVCDGTGAVKGENSKELCSSGPDNCPNVPNKEQYDADGDGKGNDCDVDFPGQQRECDLYGGEYCNSGQGLTQRDSDEDGIADAYEVEILHTDPTKPDTDGDTICDGAEAVTATEGEGEEVEENELCSAGPDNCPVDSNADQKDHDEDGVGNECDPDYAEAELDCTLTGDCPEGVDPPEGGPVVCNQLGYTDWMQVTISLPNGDPAEGVSCRETTLANGDVHLTDEMVTCLGLPEGSKYLTGATGATGTVRFEPLPTDLEQELSFTCSLEDYVPVTFRKPLDEHEFEFTLTEEANKGVWKWISGLIFTEKPEDQSQGGLKVLLKEKQGDGTWEQPASPACSSSESTLVTITACDFVTVKAGKCGFATISAKKGGSTKVSFVVQVKPPDDEWGDCIGEEGSPEPECESDADCDEGEVCTDDECVTAPEPECESDEDCSEGEVCTEGACVESGG